MNRSRLVRGLLLVVVTGTLLAFAVVVGYRPDLLPPSVATPVARLPTMFDVRTTILAVGGLLACIGLLGSWVWRTNDRTAVLSEVAVETPDREVAVTGAALTREFESTRDGRSGSEGSIEDSLRATLVDLYGREFDDPERAASYVDDGEWTDDRVAAATLTATDAVDFPLVFRLYAWLYPDHADSYRTQRALRAVEDTCAAELTGYSPPERSRGRLGRLRALFESGGDRQ